MLSKLTQLGQDLLATIYPQCCIGCEEPMQKGVNVFCMDCNQISGYTDHFEIKNNDLLLRLQPRIFPIHGAALFNYVKEGVVQTAIHSLKYSGRMDIGYKIGELFGEAYLKSPFFEKADIMIPIPIHKNRLRKREFNQSEVFAKGIKKVTNINISKNNLRKTNKSISQTTKGREDRFDTVLNSFHLNASSDLEGKTILLVDDVLTTGATIEAAFSLLTTVPNVKIQLGLMALANN